TCQLILSRFATGLGAEVLVVSDGVEAVGRLEREEFDLLILDLEMPKLSGLDVIRCLRGMPGRAARTPVVAVTAHTLRSKRQEVIAAGGKEMLSKPLLCPHAFAATIRAAIEPFESHAASTHALDPDRLNRLLALAGPETGRELLNRLMQDLSGVERGLVQAGAAQDWLAIRNHTHVLISLAGAVGSVQLQAGAEALNQLAHQADLASLGPQMHSVLNLLDHTLHFVSEVRAQHQVSVA
ncbi:MAG: response regulator, partial [Paracoccaceae bacterium]